MLGVDSYTKLLLHGDGGDVRDSSLLRKSIAVYGTVTSTTQHIVGPGSLFFDGVNDYLSLGDSTDWAFGSGDFSLESYVYFNALPGSGILYAFFSHLNTAADCWRFYVQNVSGTYRLRYYSKGLSNTMPINYAWLSLTTGQWYHVALVRTGTTFHAFIDGVIIATATGITGSNYDSGYTLTVGYTGDPTAYSSWYMDEVRLSKGIARWTEDFTPPTVGYCFDVAESVDAINLYDETSGDTDDVQVDASVVLLLHGEGNDGSTTVKDSSPSHKTVTALNNMQIDTAQHKFGGASILSDGKSDALRLADSDDWFLDTGDFTIDCWVRFSTVPANDEYQFILTQYASDASRYTFYVSKPSGIFKLNFASFGGSGNINISRNTPNFAANTWYHFAITRAGQSFKLFMNGAQLSTEYLSSNSIPNVSGYMYVGVRDSSLNQSIKGWIDELRIVKGKAVWTASFTPSTVPYGILEHSIEQLAVAEVLAPDPGLPSDALLTEDFTADDEQLAMSGEYLDGEIDEDLLLTATEIINSVNTVCYIASSFSLSAVDTVTTERGHVFTEDVTFSEDVIGQYKLRMDGAATFPLFSGAGHTGLGFNTGEMNFPVFEGVAYTGARSSNQEHPKFGLSGTMQIQYPFGQDAVHPKFSGTAAMTVGKVANGDADFPLFSGTGTMIGNPQVTGDVNFPVFGGNGGMSVGGRFANYVLRYVR